MERMPLRTLVLEVVAKVPLMREGVVGPNSKFVSTIPDNVWGGPFTAIWPLTSFSVPNVVGVNLIP